MEDPSIDDCFRSLKLRRGAAYSTVKQAYRRNLNKCHPDRFQEKPDLLPVAERKTKRLIQIYGILEQWYEQNGGRDPATSFSTDPGGSFASEFADGAEDDEADAPRVQRVRYGLYAAAAVAVFGTVAWVFFFNPQDNSPAPVAAPRPRVLAPTPTVDAKPAAPPRQTQQDNAKAGLAAMVAERDLAKAEWISAYMRAGESRRQAAEKELADAKAQYSRDVEGKAQEIKAVQDEVARQLEESRKESATAKARFATREQAYLDSIKATYETWRVAKGRDAVAKIEELRKRETSVIGVFSDTEDPRQIFDFWTPGEAGSPEINIAAKTGVTVMQPEERYFPHFRSNIFLYNPEGETLVHMMEGVVERRRALDQDTADRRQADEAELANWDSRHPPSPPRLSAGQLSVIAARDESKVRLSNANLELASAGQAETASSAEVAFNQSPVGIQWADRLLALQKTAPLALPAH